MEVVIRLEQTCNEAVARQIAQEKRLLSSEKGLKMAFVTPMTPATWSQKCFYCGRPEHTVCEYRKKRADNER